MGTSTRETNGQYNEEYSMGGNAYSNSNYQGNNAHQWAKGYLGGTRWMCQGQDRNTPQWHKAEGMGCLEMDTRGGKPWPLGSLAVTTNFEGEEHGRGSRTQVCYTRGTRDCQLEHCRGRTHPLTKGMERIKTRQ